MAKAVKKTPIKKEKKAPVSAILIEHIKDGNNQTSQIVSYSGKKLSRIEIIGMLEMAKKAIVDAK